MSRRLIVARMYRLCQVPIAVLVVGIGLLSATVAHADGPRFSLLPATTDPAVPVTRSQVILSGQPGQALQAAVQVQNTGSTPGTVRLYAVDATTEQASGEVFRNEEDPRKDVGAWVTIGTTKLTLNAGESRNVPLTIAVPASPRPGQHRGGIVAADTVVKTSQSLGAATVNFKTVTIMPVEVDLPGPVVEKMMVTGVKAEGVPGQQSLTLGMRNDGTGIVAPVGTLTVKNTQGQQVQNIPLKLRNFLPDTAIDYSVPMQTLGAGEYDATVTLTYGQSGETRSTQHFTITPAQVQQVLAPTVAAAAPAAVAPSAQPTTLAPWILLAIGAGIMLLVLLPIGAFALGRSRPR
jgi:dihydroorotate dehydrogenase (fumarate)